MQDLFIQLQQIIMPIDRIPFAVAAIVLSVLLGLLIGPIGRNALSPVFLIYGFFYNWLGLRLDKPERSRSTLVIRGLILNLFVLIVAYSLIFLHNLIFISDTLNSEFAPFVEVLIISFFLGSGSGWRMILNMNNNLISQKAEKNTYFLLARATQTDLNSTDRFGITRAGLGFLAFSFDKTMVAPIFWYLLGGIPAMIVFTSLSFLVWRFGRCGFHNGLATIPIELEKLMGIVPAVLAGFIVSSSGALIPTTNMLKSITFWWSLKNNVPYEQGGITLSALSFPLNVVTGGPVVDLDGYSLPKTWVGPNQATAQLKPAHLLRGCAVIIIAHFLFILILLCAYLFGIMRV